ncbi:MAG TPA: bifunctional UDP-N-acetylglucosamine diphosphorylase/glucosamine-1-phosphate N-acetyltransferase GlmU [Nocardioidaceae bacterium]|nr:bifunctional UDP-N-acetylglucosamine diphosphorylase/glucosamine-1-phosphate N-acetyltransferase GlmU [Nocardioidaceae bacterium]
MSEAVTTTVPRPAAVILLAAGSGTRMKSKTMKVLHPICGRSLIGHVIAASEALDPEHLVAVVGNQREQVEPHVLEQVPDAVIAMQETQDGTGHAVRIAVETLQRRAGTPDGTVVVMFGDTPLLEGETVAGLVADHTGSGRALTILTAEVENPFGYGRIVRDAKDEVAAIVEEKDATPEQAAIKEINSGIFAFDGAFLADAVTKITNDNAKGEYYLTDVVAIARERGLTVGAYSIDDVMQTEGANDRAQLAGLAAEMNRRVLTRWMKDGVTVVDPATTWVDVTVELARDVTLLPGVQLHGSTRVEEDAVVGPDTTLTDVTVGEGATVVRTHGSGAVVGPGASVGPFSYLRPGTVLGAKGKIGTFVETKNAQIGEGAKVPHLSYVGDAEIGEGTNIGAGTIFANYDGVHKHRTTVGRQARTGSNNTFIAPVNIGDGAVTGGGTVVRRDVPPGALAVSTGPQRHIEEWVLRKRRGSAAAEAAEAALARNEAAQRASSHKDGSEFPSGDGPE